MKMSGQIIRILRKKTKIISLCKTAEIWFFFSQTKIYQIWNTINWSQVHGYNTLSKCAIKFFFPGDFFEFELFEKKIKRN